VIDEIWSNPFNSEKEKAMSRKIQSKLVHIISLLIALGLFLSACQTNPATPATQTPSPVKITFWSHDFAPREKLDRVYMDKFMSENPNVEIEYVLGPADDVQYITKLMTAMAGGEGPDCFNMLTLGAGLILANGMGAPLDPKLLGYDNLDVMKAAYVEGILDGFIQDGKLYAVPSEVSIYSLYLNEQMFRDAGLDPKADAPKTWSDMLTLAKKMNQEKNGQLMKRAFDFTYGMPEDTSSPILTVAGMAHQLGGEIFNADQTKALVNTEPWVKSYQFIQDWVYKWKYGNPALTVGKISFYTGDVAMTVAGSWYSSYIKEQGPAVYNVHTVVPLPRWENAVNDSGAYKYAYGLYTNAASSPEKQQACQRLIGELISHPAEYLEQAGLLQPTKALQDSEVFKNTPNLDIFMSELTKSPYWPVHPKDGEIIDSLTRALQRVTMEHEDVQKALDTSKSEIDAFLAAP
jgi:multiple sugar transport system substrate-binding protein